MKTILVTMRSDYVEAYQEQRDAVDVKWYDFLSLVGVTPVLLPNHVSIARNLISSGKFDGVLLTGGGQYEVTGKDPRSMVETHLIQHCEFHRIPLLGVCRGMQVIQQYYGVELSTVEGHIQTNQQVATHNGLRQVNSYRNFGTIDSCRDLAVWAKSADGVVKAVSHRELPLTGIMWHPERIFPFAKQDINLFQEHFSV